MVAAKKKSLAQRDKASLLHETRTPRKKSTNNSISRNERKFSVPLSLARLTILENVLVEKSTHEDTPFLRIESISNPRTTSPDLFPVLQYWFETYRTTEREAINQVLRLTQEVIFGSNIISNRSTEAGARQECYGLAEEVEERISGLMPTINNDIEVIFPIHDIDASFVQMEGSGLFTLNIMWTLTWQIAKGAKV
jgi:hypothetical protein